MKKYLLAGALCLAALVGACGGGSDPLSSYLTISEDISPVMSPSMFKRPPPKVIDQIPMLAAKEAKVLYDNLPEVLEKYVEGQTLNRDLTVVYGNSCVPAKGGSRIIVSVVYKGEEIQNIKSVPMGCYSGIYVRHGFARNGSYIIVLDQVLGSQISKFFVDGKHIPIDIGDMYFYVNGLVDLTLYGETYLLISTGRSLGDPLRGVDSYIFETMSALNVRTGQFIVFGVP